MASMNVQAAITCRLGDKSLLVGKTRPDRCVVRWLFYTA